MAEAKKAVAQLQAKNLAQIKKIDICAAKIIDKVNHAALYNFNIEKSQWDKTEIEGAMFIYQRIDKPYFSLMIANRHTPNDFIEPIIPSLKVNCDKNYLFYCKSDGKINGLWFYNPKDCNRIASLVEKLVEKSKSQENEASAKAADTRSAKLLELIRGGKHNSIQQSYKEQDSSQRSDENDMETTPKSTKGAETSSISSMPALLQKLMIQEQPKIALAEPGTTVPLDELEKDLLKTARPKPSHFQDFGNSPSAASLAGISTKSVHGSEEEAVDFNEKCSLEDASFVVGSGSGIETPPLNKDQFLSAFMNLLQTDEQFLSQIHQAYVDALNRRFNL